MLKHPNPRTLMRRLSIRFLIVASIAVCSPALVFAQGACEAMPRGPKRTDCFINRARIANQKANLAYDKARTQADAARLRAVTGATVHYREACRGKRAGTRACYICCRAHGLSASRCLRTCRRP